ncbi:ABC transporter substrate-binding protein [Shewanella sp. SR44-3]|uniref:substrate-binding periplasmic protein n=1 Tax=Shewanella sp. SR44-3 TaxID=2760936 RepID=UPI002175D91F|nr:ABC transporter substrate-binding protein [Shewanella sp. SR44-3]
MRILSILLASLLSFTAHADELNMAFGESIPPFSFPDSHSGIEIEIISAALAVHGHSINPSYLPLARVPFGFKQGEFDAAMTDLGQDMQALGAYYGDPAVLYDNVFISLAERKLEIKAPEDLQGLSIVSFQGAYKRYPEWLMTGKLNGLYTENFRQENQVLLLERGHFDLALSDINIFKYHQIQVHQNLGTPLKTVKFHHFVRLDPNDYRPVFWKKNIRDDFNDGLKKIKKTGEYQAIYDRYLIAPMTALETINNTTLETKVVD